MNKNQESNEQTCKAEGRRDQRIVKPRLPVPGWNYVKCDECGTVWRETSRDIQSPSRVDCINHCDHGGDTNVWRSDHDASLERDASGNILRHQCEILAKGLGHNADGDSSAVAD